MYDSTGNLTARADGDIDNVAKVLATAFASDAFSIAACGGDTSKIYDFERATVAAAALSGELWVASHGKQDFASVAVWIHPDRELLDRHVPTLLRPLHSTECCVLVPTSMRPATGDCLTHSNPSLNSGGTKYGHALDNHTHAHSTPVLATL